ncbi:hypothetical protein [Sulfurovum sp. NBC37-1]|uniref:hypothetical protein n=1 Tax=Sulfurovum sp. (strain NBC37-1) TaxID=387093 RepID=UPI0001587B0D|nr:hypothetical protein [Sulfurovum sp. NBC37-1]BAF73357.1 hypothetical protein SUN_2421 [Sulfurovum sp. NBC37-1]
MKTEIMEIEHNEFWKRVQKLEQATAALKAVKYSAIGNQYNEHVALTQDEIEHLCDAVIELIEPAKDLFYSHTP